MTIAQLLTSDFAAQISVSGVYVTISGLNNITWEEDTADIDVTTFDNNGWGSMMTGTRNATITLEGFRLADSETGVRDPGQKHVEKAARQNGFAGRRTYRIIWKTDPTQYIQVNAYAKNGTFGGGLDEAAPWSCNLMTDGAPTISGAMFNYDL